MLKEVMPTGMPHLGQSWPSQNSEQRLTFDHKLSFFNFFNIGKNHDKVWTLDGCLVPSVANVDTFHLCPINYPFIVYVHEKSQE